jgi:hypothetical protein
MKMITSKSTRSGRKVKLMILATALILVAVIGFLVARSSFTFRQVQGESTPVDLVPENSIDLTYTNLVSTYPFHLMNATTYANNTIRIDLWFFQLNGTARPGVNQDTFIVYGEANIYPAQGYQIKAPLTIPLLTTEGPPVVFEMDLSGVTSAMEWEWTDSYIYVNNQKTAWTVQGNTSEGAYYASYNMTPCQKDLHRAGSNYYQRQIWPEDSNSPQEHRLAVVIVSDVGKDILGFNASLAVALYKPFVGDMWGNGIVFNTTLTTDHIVNLFGP